MNDLCCSQWLTGTTVSHRCKRGVHPPEIGHNAGTGVTWWPEDEMAPDDVAEMERDLGPRIDG
jgi:hypothetical protein